jgi:hypothetical protein
MRELIKKTDFYSLFRSDEGFIAELNIEALSGVSGLINIELTDTNELLLVLRTAKIINETINPTDVVRGIMANQRRVHQQSLLC